MLARPWYDLSVKMQQVRLHLSLYQIFFYFYSFVNESIVISFSRPAYTAHTVAMLLHGYWAIYDPPSTSPLYAAHHTTLVITISCKRQGVPPRY